MRLIDSTQLILNANNDEFVTMHEIVHAPGIDPVHAMGSCYFKECKYHNYDEKSFVHSCIRPLGALGCAIVREDDYCSYGELIEWK